MNIEALTKEDIKRLYEQSTPSDNYRIFAFASHDLINAFDNIYEKYDSDKSDGYNCLQFFFYDEDDNNGVPYYADILPTNEGEISMVSINCFINTNNWETLGIFFKTEKGNLYFEDDFEEKYRKEINTMFLPDDYSDDCYEKGFTLFKEYGEEHGKFPIISLEFDTDLIGNPFDEANSNPSADHPYIIQNGYDSINEYGTEIYDRTVEIGKINDAPLYMDIRLRRNEKEDFINVDCADGENKCWGGEDAPDMFFPVPDEIAKRTFELVSERFNETYSNTDRKKSDVERD